MWVSQDQRPDPAGGSMAALATGVKTSNLLISNLIPHSFQTPIPHSSGAKPYGPQGQWRPRRLYSVDNRMQSRTRGSGEALEHLSISALVLPALRINAVGALLDIPASTATPSQGRPIRRGQQHRRRRGFGRVRRRVGAPVSGNNSFVAQRLGRIHPVSGTTTPR